VTWAVERMAGSAAEFHARPLPDPPRRVVSVLRVDRPALVLGSAQPESDAGAGPLALAGVDLVRRRSGGGAVLLEPEDSLWVDVVVPPGDPLWDDDVGRAFHWLGHVWQGTLAAFGVDASVHTGPLVGGPWSRMVCFGGLGPGEVVVGGRKVVGISQRRTRLGARFQCVLLRRWDPRWLLALLTLDEERRHLAERDLAGAAAGLDLPFDEVVEAFLRYLPATGR
jgi:lipoate---protein ligase